MRLFDRPQSDVRTNPTLSTRWVLAHSSTHRQPARSREGQARELFAPLGPTYDRVSATLSLGQDPRWRRFLVSRLPRGGHVLDVATGTGLVAAELLRRGFRVTGVDQSPEMLAIAHRRFRGDVTLVQASAEALPHASESFDHLTVTYLLRYVADPEATLAELARVVRPGGCVASLEFGVSGGPARPFWELYVRTGLPLAGRLLRNGWGRSAISSATRSAAFGSATRWSANSRGGTRRACTGSRCGG